MASGVHRSILSIAQDIIKLIGKDDSIIGFVGDRPGYVFRHTGYIRNIKLSFRDPQNLTREENKKEQKVKKKKKILGKKNTKEEQYHYHQKGQKKKTIRKRKPEETSLLLRNENKYAN